jgi:head-tail adaptor
MLRETARTVARIRGKADNVWSWAHCDELWANIRLRRGEENEYMETDGRRRGYLESALLTCGVAS